MIRIDLDDRVVAIRLSGWDAAFALRRTLRVPVRAIGQARAAPWLIDARPSGLRATVASWPFWLGPVFAGSYLGTGRQWSFWAVRRAAPDQLLELRIADAPDAGRYRTIVVTVDSGIEVAARIERARTLDTSG